MNEHTLLFDAPATHFEEALPLGNGRLGAMVYGRTDREKISWNEDSLWSGHPGQNPAPPHAPQAFEKARKLALQGDYEQAQQVIEQEFNGHFTQEYLPLGNLFLELNHQKITNYRRTLDLETAAAHISYESDGVHYERHSFLSAPDQVGVTRLSCGQPGGLSLTLTLESPLEHEEPKAEGDLLLLTGRCPSHMCQRHTAAPTVSEESISFAWGVQVIADGGAVTFAKGALSVTGADQVLLLCTASTDYNRQTGLIDPALSPLLQVKEHLRHDCFEELYRRHLADYQPLYQRCRLTLSREEDPRTTPTRLQEANDNPGLYELLFHFGRYLTLAASRSGSQATNLQGIWNEKMSPPWSSNYTVNINTEMNYWPTLPTHLEECFEPFARLAQGVLQQGGATAKAYYNAPGIVSHHNIDLWYHTNPVGYQIPHSAVWAFWNLSSGWIGCMLYDRWLFERDEEQLKTLIWPFIKEASRFYLAVMTDTEEGTRILAPSTSPENKYKRNGAALAVTRTTAMTVSILTDLFRAALSCGKLLGDEELEEELTLTLSKLPPLPIGENGTVLEWMEPLEEEDPHHRHVSHLYGLYPGHSITPRKTPELAEAVRQTLLTRGDEGTGWSLAWKLNLWARLGDGEHALRILKRQTALCPCDGTVKMTKGGSYPNLLGAHPPFQIDCNYGVTAGIANMLLQNEEDALLLLPALPASWQEGEIQGLRAYGGITVDLSWQGARATARLTSPAACQITLIADGKPETVSLPQGQPYEFTWTLSSRA